MGKNTLEGAIPSTGRGVRLTVRELSVTPTQSSRPVGTPRRIWASSLCPSQASLQGQVGSAPAIWTASRATLGIQRPAPVHDASFLPRLRGHVF